MRRTATIAIATLMLFLGSCVSTTTVEEEQLNDAQRLEKYDNYVPWWLQEQH